MSGIPLSVLLQVWVPPLSFRRCSAADAVRLSRRPKPAEISRAHAEIALEFCDFVAMSLGVSGAELLGSKILSPLSNTTQNVKNTQKHCQNVRKASTAMSIPQCQCLRSLRRQVLTFFSAVPLHSESCACSAQHLPMTLSQRCARAREKGCHASSATPGI